MDEKAAKALRAPFPPEVIGKLPRVFCGQCRDAIKNRRSNCDKHERVRCRECGNTMTAAHLHLDYVGHAAITDRLLAVDPGWVWEPVAFGPDGLPVLDRNGGLWIRLTVAGVTRLGYGDAEGKTGPQAVKEAIGDALRNGAMRFGVGLDLWHKDGQLVHDDDPTPQPQPPAPRNGSQPAPKLSAAPPPAVSTEAREALEELDELCKVMAYDLARVAALFAEQHKGSNIRNATTPDHAKVVRAFTAKLDEVDPTRIKAQVQNGAKP